METIAATSTPISRSTKGYIICVGAAVALAFTGIFIRYLTETYQLPPLVLAFWRDVIVSISLALILFITNRKLLHLERKNLPFIFTYGLVLTLFNSIWTFSVALNGAAVSTVLAYSSAAFTALLAWRFLRESLGMTKITAVSLGLLGCVLVSGAYTHNAWSINPAGILTGILSGLIFATFSLIGKVSSNRGINSWTAQLYSFAFASVFFLPIVFVSSFIEGTAPIRSFLWLGNNITGWLVLIILAIGPTLGGYGLYMLSLTYLPASVVNLIAMLEPPMTAILAFLLLSERLTGMQLAGSALIISSVLLLRLFEK